MWIKKQTFRFGQMNAVKKKKNEKYILKKKIIFLKSILILSMIIT